VGKKECAENCAGSEKEQWREIEEFSRHICQSSIDAGAKMVGVKAGVLYSAVRRTSFAFLGI
jgi:hypothetical protein